jgi:hypothetical protein
MPQAAPLAGQVDLRNRAGRKQRQTQQANQFRASDSSHVSPRSSKTLMNDFSAQRNS